MLEPWQLGLYIGTRTDHLQTTLVKFYAAFIKKFSKSVIGGVNIM